MAAATVAMVAGSAMAAPVSASRLSSSAAFDSAPVHFAPLRNVSVSNSGVVAVNASLSEENTSVKRKVLNSILAAGLAISLSSSAIAASGPGIDGAERTARKADQLLQGADALIKNDSPKRFGPDRGLEAASEDAERFSQKAGSGAIPEIQATSSAQVSDARDKFAANLQKTQRRIDGIWGQGKGMANDLISTAGKKTDDVTKGVKKSFGKATSNNVGNTAKNVAAGVKSKADEVTAPAKSGGFFGKIKQQSKGLQGAVAMKAEEATKALPGK